MSSDQSFFYVTTSFAEAPVPKSTVFGKEIRSWRSFTWEEWFLIAATSSILSVSATMFCFFVVQQLAVVDWVFTTLNLVGYIRFGFIGYYAICGILNHESFAMLALTGSLFLQLMLASKIYAVNSRTDDTHFSVTINLLYLGSVSITPIAVIASALLTCKYWKQSMLHILDIQLLYPDPDAKEQAVRRRALIVKCLLSFEFQWSLLCLTVVMQQYRHSELEDSFALTTGFVLIIIRSVIAWILIGRQPWRVAEIFLATLGLILVPSHFIYFYLKLVVPNTCYPLTITGLDGCIPLTVAALCLLMFIFLNHTFLFIITHATPPLCEGKNVFPRRGRHLRPPGEENSLLSSRSRGTASTFVH